MRIPIPDPIGGGDSTQKHERYGHQCGPHGASELTGLGLPEVAWLDTIRGRGGLIAGGNLYGGAQDDNVIILI